MIYINKIIVNYVNIRWPFSVCDEPFCGSLDEGVSGTKGGLGG